MMDDLEDQKAALDDMLAFARGGVARNMRKRLGKPMPPEAGAELPEGETPPPEEPSMSEDVPGAEAPEGEADVSIEASGSGIDPEMLRTILEALRAGK